MRGTTRSRRWRTRPQTPRSTRGTTSIKRALRWCSVVGVMALATALAGPALASTDTTPPTLVSSSLDGSVVDVSDGPQDLVVTLHITDAESGFQSGGIVFTGGVSGGGTGGGTATQLESGFNDTQRVAGDAFDGTYAVHVPIPQYAAPGSYCGVVAMTDVAQNTTQASLGTSLADCLTVQDTNADLVAPSVYEQSLSPTALDVSTSAQDITITLTIFDTGEPGSNSSGPDVSGFASGQIALTDGSGKQYAATSITESDRTTGTATYGAYAVTLTVPRYLPAGDYCLPMILTDNAGNTMATGVPGRPGVGCGSSPSYPIADTQPDASPPILDSFDSTNQIQVPRRATDLPVELSISDPGFAGFDHGTLRLVQQTAGGTEYDADISATDRTSGTPTHGDYRVSVPLPADVADGQYCGFVSLTDAAGNTFSQQVSTGGGGLTNEACVEVQNLQSMVLSPDPVGVAVGGNAQVLADAQYATGTSTLGVTRQATWYTDDHTIATVSSTGLVTGVAAGTTTVTATLNGLSDTATVTVTGATATPEVVHVTGTSTYGAGASFTGSTSDGTPVLGTITCTTVDDRTTITSGLTTGTHTIDGDSCSGASLADSDRVVDGYQGTLTVAPAELTVTAENASRDYGEPNPAFSSHITGFVNGDTGPDAYSGSPELTTTAGETSDPGSYDITATKGSLVSANYTFRFVSGTLTVDKAAQQVRFTSTPLKGESYGFTYFATAVGGGSGNPVRFSVPDSSAGVCSAAGPLVSFIGVGLCVVDADQAGNVDYAAATRAQQSFEVGPAALRITASSPPAITYGDPAPMITPSYAGFVNGDTAESLTSTPTCSTPYLQGSDTGTYVTSCSGAAIPKYFIGYLKGSLTVDKAATTMTAGDGQLVMAGNPLGLSATLSSSAAGCQAGQPVSFGVSPNPTGGSGAYSVSATTGGSGIASTNVDSGEWAEGAYTVTASYAGDGNCIGSTDTTTVTVAAPGDAASGGGWLTSSGSGRLNFAFTVRQVPHSKPVAYRGHLTLVNNGKWKLAGTIGSYGLVDAGSTGVVAGSGDLYWWNPALDGGLGDWVLAKSGASFTARFTATSRSGRGKQATGSPGSFGITIGGYTPRVGQPALPDIGLVDLKGGRISLS